MLWPAVLGLHIFLVTAGNVLLKVVLKAGLPKAKSRFIMFLGCAMIAIFIAGLASNVLRVPYWLFCSFGCPMPLESD